ncbi:hypothetical protein [Oceanicoccus sp. KOV_DT_Chl]|uniref:hypothetical protein n=1 Tax=Oceanicoccus sp. KOV_DT_Chl TaxID=1904639 RepID=UPI000C7D75CC|nr:hypothetical protein [Oceanicoccus sp. KOV_DT_Chl]
MVKEIEAQVAFAKPADVVDDLQRKGMLRATAHPIDADQQEAFELKPCRLRDWSAPSESKLNLETMGFDHIELPSNALLQNTLENVRLAGKISRVEASIIRKQLKGRSFKLSSGKRLRLLFIAAEGFIMRKAGPNGMKVDPDIAMSEMNGHDGALTVHADQDVRGTPLKQMMHGAAPGYFDTSHRMVLIKYRPFF